MKKFVSTVAVCILAAGLAFAAPKSASSASAATLTCPVLGNRIASPASAAGKAVYKGKTYYFCCPSCKPKFDKNPAKYIHLMAMRSKMSMKSGKKICNCAKGPHGKACTCLKGKHGKKRVCTCKMSNHAAKMGMGGMCKRM